MSGDLGVTCQIGFAVTDFDAAMALWRKDQGVGPWFFMPEVRADNYVCGQATYFVRDIDAAIEEWIRERGVGPWFVTAKLEAEVVDRGRAGKVVIRKAYANALDAAAMQVELVEIEPSKSSVSDALVAADPKRVSSISCWFTRPSTTLEAKRDRVTALGYGVAQSTTCSSLGETTLFMENRERPGMFVLVGSAGADRARVFKAIREAAMLWNGADRIRPFPVAP